MPSLPNESGGHPAHTRTLGAVPPGVTCHRRPISGTAGKLRRELLSTAEAIAMATGTNAELRLGISQIRHVEVEQPQVVCHAGLFNVLIGVGGIKTDPKYWCSPSSEDKRRANRAPWS